MTELTIGNMGPTPFDWVSFGIASVGAATGIAALTWEVASYRLSGARVVVELGVAWRGPGGAFHGKPGVFNDGEQPGPGYPEECFAVTVRNRGRLATSVNTWAVEIGPASLTAPLDPWNKTLPHRLEANESVTFLVEKAAAREAAAALTASATGGAEAVTVRASASTGDGRSHESANSTTLPTRATRSS